MFNDYSSRLFSGLFLLLGIIFGGQLLIYWLIDKYTSLNFPLGFRILVAIVGVFIIPKIIAWLC